jgi:hypothetical protein
MTALRQVAACFALGTALLATGCSSEPPPKVPPNAMLESEGDGRVAYTATHDGTAYIYDVGADRIVWSGPVDAGQTIVVNPSDDRVTVGDRVAAEKLLHNGHQHRVFFVDTATAPDAHHKVVIEKQQTTIERR